MSLFNGLAKRALLYRLAIFFLFLSPREMSQKCIQISGNTYRLIQNIVPSLVFLKFAPLLSFEGGHFFYSKAYKIKTTAHNISTFKLNVEEPTRGQTIADFNFGNFNFLKNRDVLKKLGCFEKFAPD